MQNKDLKILIVDDEVLVLEMIVFSINQLGFTNTRKAHTREAALKLVSQFNPHIIFLDIAMEGKFSGIEICREIKQKQQDTPLYFLTSYTTDFIKDSLQDIDYQGIIDKSSYLKDIQNILKTFPKNPTL